MRQPLGWGCGRGDVEIAGFAARIGAQGPEVILQELRLVAVIWDVGWRSLSMADITSFLTRSSSEGVVLESGVHHL